MNTFFVEPDCKKQFTLYFYSRHIELLKKYNFKEEFCIDSFSNDEKHIISELKELGLIYSFYCNKKEYIQGTKIYLQFIS